MASAVPGAVRYGKKATELGYWTKSQTLKGVVLGIGLSNMHEKHTKPSYILLYILRVFELNVTLCSYSN